MPEATLEGWEKGSRGGDPRSGAKRADAVRRIAVELEAGPALERMWYAVGTPVGLPARSDWQLNYPEPGRECWVWIRIPAGGTASLNWGPVKGRLQVPAGDGGVLVQIQTSVRNPPLEVRLTGPGWCDGGHGLVPEAVGEALDATVVQANDIHVRSRPAWRGYRLPAGALAWFDKAAGKFRVNADLAIEMVGETLYPARDGDPRTSGGADLVPSTTPGPAETDTAGTVRQLLLSREQAKTLRRARGFSPEAAAAAASTDELRTLPGTREQAKAVDRQVVQRMENEGTLPRAEHALARLDVVYGADGRLAVERTHDSRSPEHKPVHDYVNGPRKHVVEFPDWWTGPVWLQPVSDTGRDQKTTVRLRWGPWTRTQKTDSGTCLTTRKAPPEPGRADLPLRVELPPGWRLIAGTGQPPNAIDVGRGWYPGSWADLAALIAEAARALRVDLPSGNDGRRADGP